MEPQSIDANIPSCSFGSTNGLDCHLLTWCATKGLKYVKELEYNQQKLLIQRIPQNFDDSATICLHHEAIFLTKFDFLQKYCCNSFLKSGHNAKKSLRIVDERIAQQLKMLTKGNYFPGQKLCITCRKELHKQLDSSLLSSDNEENDSDIEKVVIADKVNSSLKSLDISPLKFSKISKRDSIGYAKRKVSQVRNSLDFLGKRIADSGGVNISDITTEISSINECKTCLDYNELISELKQKLQIVSNHAEKLQILTLAPKSWSIEKTMLIFGVSKYMILTARKLKAEGGILAMPHKKEGKLLPNDIKNRVLGFFEDDEYSRICPGKKDYVCVRIEGEKQQKQKRLLLSTLKEMFVEYRMKYGAEISFSKFCELRPKWCVSVGSPGMHSVCVCNIHQNIKLMLHSSIVTEDYKLLLSKTVCDLESKNCMLRQCDQCPGKNALENYFLKIYSDIDPEESISFKQWVQTDRTTLDTKQMTTEDFVAELVEKISNLSIHHFISKNQSQYLKTIKENLKTGELVVLMDFAENFSFIVQDSAQGFHWENSQATLHPFSVYYYHQDQSVECFSICMISDSLRHDTVAVHAFLVKLIEYLKTIFSELRYIRYFSDGCVSQYKNYKNFLNLCNHFNDFNIHAEWNFFGTSHGKSSCDGIAGTTKRVAALASLQRPVKDQILTPKDLFNFCDKHMKKIKYFFVSNDDIESLRYGQEQRFHNACTVAGTRENHQFIPINCNNIRVCRVSGDCVYFISKIRKVDDNDLYSTITVLNILPGQYIACIYDNKWWVGNVCDTSVERHDVQVNLMHPHGPCASFFWPTRKDIRWVSEEHILTVLPLPNRLLEEYTFAQFSISIVEKNFKQKVANGDFKI